MQPTSSDSRAVRDGRVDAFALDRIELDDDLTRLAFHFSLRSRAETVHAFTERITLANAVPGRPAVSVGELEAEDPELRERFARLATLLGVVLGLSYYKLHAPGRYEVSDELALTPAGRALLAATLHDGLGEFAYVNRLDGLLSPEIAVREVVPLASSPLTAHRARLPLVPLGGGKDSSTSVELLRHAGVDVVQVAARPNSIIEKVAARAELPLVAIGRELDPLLFELNDASDTLNGHVPVTAMNSLLSVLQSLRLGRGPVVMSNESSASEGNLVWHGESVNHQWSKSLDAERMLERAVAEATGERGRYFSLLRHMSELRIVRAFSGMPRYDDVVVSCNRAFRRSAVHPSWCGECDKCRFIFLCMSAFYDRDRLIGMFGRDLFEAADQLDGFLALVGEGAMKPFDCVGEASESIVAFADAAANPQWRAEPIVRAIVARVPDLEAAAGAQRARVYANGPRQSFPDPVYEEAIADV